MAQVEAGRSHWALVTGASSGLGIEFARQLAQRGYNLVLVARREEPMQRLAADLAQTHAIDVLVETIDLAFPNSAKVLLQNLDANGVPIDVLVNNAGFGVFGRFAKQSPGRIRQMLDLDILALTEMTLVFGRHMLDRGHGHILLVASTAAMQPTPLYAAYGAAKAYVLSLGESLNVEFAPVVGVTVVLPGLMNTGFLGVSGQQPTAIMKRNMTDPADAARIGLDAMFAGRSTAIIGSVNKIASLINRLTSRSFQAKLIMKMQQE